MRWIVARPAGCLAPLLITAVLAAQAPPQDPEAAAKAAAVRAAMLFKIAGYLEIAKPEQPPQQFRIGLLGDDAAAATARKILPGKTVGARKIVVVAVPLELAAAGRAAELCELLYVAAPIDSEALAKILTGHQRQRVALVGELPGFAAGGGTIQLFVKDAGIKFEVNSEVLRRQGLGASSQFLKHSQKGPER